MSKIVFFCIPAHGHTNPTLGVVRELVKRGHQVWYYSYEMMREKIEDAGAVFIPCDQYDGEMKLSKAEGAKIGKDMALSIRVLVDTTLALDEIVCRHMAEIRPDCIVADSMAVWGKAAAKKLGIPFVCSTTTFAFNKESSKVMKQSLADLFRMIFAMPKVNKQIKRLQNAGYPVKSILDIIANDENTDTIVYTSPQFQPCADTFNEKYAFVGPVLRETANEIPKKKPKLVYISMGTVNNDMLTLYKKCINAFADKDIQVIISAGQDTDISKLGELPENIGVYHSVDQIAVLKKADAFVTHCGMNSVSEGLYFGVPLAMLPVTSEQKGVCERVLQLGAGIRGNENDIYSAVEILLNDEKYRKNAGRIAESFKNCSGAEGAADKIEQVCRKNI
ncbi:MAG: glucosyltransferase [Ruminococcaceae bacterium]|nr:glucosyltransferase [Oscillospiraceae bacterium]